MDALTASIGAAGESLAAATTSKATTGTRTRYGTVAANNGTTLDVTLSGGTLAALPMTADCTGAAVGDRVAVSVDGPLATVTGIVATSDTGGYDIFAGTKVINTSSSNVLFTDDEFKAAFGRSFDQATDCIVGMNGDSDARSGKTCSLSYNPDSKNIWLEGVGASGLYRVNYILAMPSGSTRTVAQGVASATSRATTAAEAANEAAKAAQEAATGVSEATDKANAAAESATAAADKVDGAITEATEAATKATDAAAGAEGAATSATSAAGEATTAASTATTAADGAAKVNATLDGTKLTVTDRTGASTTVDTKGATGATGAKGDKGDKGDTGAKGADGAGARWNLATGSLNWTGGAWSNLSLWTDEGIETLDGTPYSVRSRSFTWSGIGSATAHAAGTYTLSLYAKADDASVSVWFCNTKAGQSISTGTLNTSKAALTTEWQRLTWTFTATEAFDRPRLEKREASGAKVYVAGYKLEQASAATDYRPAIADISDATEAEYDRQVARGTYAGRSIQTILGCSTWADTYAALHAKVAAADFSGLRVGDYLDVTFTGTDLITTATQRFVLAHFDPYLNTGTDALTSHHVAFVAQKVVTVASGVTGYVNSGRIQWNTTATNNGTSAQPAPYMASNLHAFEVKLAAELPSSISGYVISRTARLETRYSAAGTLTDSNGYNPVAFGKLWSMSEVEYTGLCSWGTRGWSSATDRQLDLMRAAMPSTIADGFWLRTAISGGSTGVIAIGTDNRTASFAADSIYLMPRPCFLFA